MKNRGEKANGLLEFIEKQVSYSPSPCVEALLKSIQERFGHSTQAVLYYGSCLRSGNEFDGLVDLYLLVDGYSHAFGKFSPSAIFNAMLPPNVYYLEARCQGRVVRAKLAVMSLDDFAAGASSWFHSYIWGRFCQPCAIVYTSDTHTYEKILSALAASALSFASAVLPCLDEKFTAEEFWCRGFRLTYSAELRSEGSDRARTLYDADQGYYNRLLREAMPMMQVDAVFEPDAGNRGSDRPHAAYFMKTSPSPGYCGFAWKLRQIQGKLLSVLRLIKAGFTFRGGIDYILWKVERHSGVRVSVSPKLRRCPPLAAVVLAWRLYQRGGFR